MSTASDRAATCIQARIRGFQWRRHQCRVIKAVIKLQALQRGRFTRREFAKLRDFSREQETFQQATKQRQVRIWHNEQELYLLQHTNAADLEKLRSFQQQHAAKLIQRTWRALRTSSVHVIEKSQEIIEPCDRIYTFDPFGFATTGASAIHPFPQWKHEETEFEACRQPSLSPFSSEIRREASTAINKLPITVADDEAFAIRRKKIQERIKRKAAQEIAKAEPVVGSEKVRNQRRVLYEQVAALKATTAKRVLRYEVETRALRRDKQVLALELAASCEKRLRHLQDESPEQMTVSEQRDHLVCDQAHSMKNWSTSRRLRAWTHHRRALSSVLNKQHWWQTHLAGDERDIRRVVVAKSPWEDERNIWVWPRSKCGNQDEGKIDSVSMDVWPSIEIERFLCGDRGLETSTDQMRKPVSDAEASEWWRAHCTQSHLATNGALLVEELSRMEVNPNVSDKDNVFPVCTSEMVANRDLYKLIEESKRSARIKTLERDIEQRCQHLNAQIEQCVHEMEVQVEANTQLALQLVQQEKAHQARLSREQQASIIIQRYARGMQGRKHAREVRAEFFVMVRGRAIRRGRCEECGEQRAVLECQQCEESLHFCPICWVHVHSTRRRKTHVAIPMSMVADPTPTARTKPSP